jgi:hypothetical protein
LRPLHQIFATKKPLGVTLEQHAEWAVVKLATDKHSGIEIGSVLTAVNGESVILQQVRQRRDCRPLL